MARQKVWMKMPPKPVNPSPLEVSIITGACDALIRDKIKPRCLPQIIETDLNYAIDIHGAWRAGRYRFMVRYRSGWPDTFGEEFDQPYARLDHMGPDNFDIYWRRHNGQWWPLHRGKTFVEAITILEEDGVLRPVC